MSVSDADIAVATDLLSPLRAVSKRKMFGGLGICHDAKMFALLDADGRLFIKTNKAFAADLETEGAEQFHNMPYWSMPERGLDAPDLALSWASQSLTISKG